MPSANTLQTPVEGVAILVQQVNTLQVKEAPHVPSVLLASSLYLSNVLIALLVSTPRKERLAAKNAPRESILAMLRVPAPHAQLVNIKIVREKVIARLVNRANLALRPKRLLALLVQMALSQTRAQPFALLVERASTGRQETRVVRAV